LTKNYISFYPKIVNKLFKIRVWDPGSEIKVRKNPFGIPDPGSQKGTGSRIPDPDATATLTSKTRSLSNWSKVNSTLQDSTFTIRKPLTTVCRCDSKNKRQAALTRRHRFNMELDPQSLYGLYVHGCIPVLIG
jgi:hypothetical protein